MQFTYRAKKDPQTEATGVIEALDLSAAITHLKQMGLYPLEVVALENPASAASGSARRVPQTLPRMALVLWARTVGQGLAAGLSLTQALSLLGEQEKERPLGVVAKTLQEQVTGGMSLADAMEHMGKFFPPVAISLARAGEASGSLEEVLQSLADQVESEADLMERVRGALIYPVFVLIVAIAAIAIQNWLVVPKLTLLFTENGQPIPWTMQLTMAVGKAAVLVLGAVPVLGIVFAMGKRFQWWQVSMSNWGLGIMSRIPWFRRLIRHAEIARLSSSLGLLLSHGLPLPESLRLVAGVVTRAQLKAQIQQAQVLVVEGMNVSASFQRAGIEEPFLLTLVAMGEAQGDLARSFQQAGSRYRHEVDRVIKVLSTLIEPVMILVVGVVVGAIVLSLLLSIFQINFAVG